MTRRRETPQTERPGSREAGKPGSREVKSLDIDKFILLPGGIYRARELEKNLKKVLDKPLPMWHNPK